MMQQLWIDLTASSKYYYGMRLRPFSIATQPNGYIEYFDVDDVPRDIVKGWTRRDYAHGVLVYPHKLSDRDRDHYDLTDMNEPTDDEKWNAFENFVKFYLEYELEFDDFVKHCIKPSGEYFDRNPYKKSMDLFQALAVHGFQGSLRGLKDLYNSIQQRQ